MTTDYALWTYNFGLRTMIFELRNLDFETKSKLNALLFDFCFAQRVYTPQLETGE